MAAFGTTYLGGEWRALKPSIGGELEANSRRIVRFNDQRDRGGAALKICFSVKQL
jgi:hypothetical protein